METALFGLPLATVLIYTGVPVILALFLVWWGLTYKPSDEGGQSDGGKKR